MYLTQHRAVSAIIVAISLIGGYSASETENNVGQLMLATTRKLGQKEADDLPAFEHTVKFHLFTKLSKKSPLLLIKDGVETLENSSFDPAKKTLVVIHGFQSSIESEGVQDIKDAALEFLDVNVIAVDWNFFTRNPNYAFVVNSVEGVGTYVGQFVKFLIEQGASNADVHFIGHSLGAHVAGYAGKLLRANGLTAARITGLDPAFPGYYDLNDSYRRLNSTDAEFVDCIHTCGGKLGILASICQADFLPNGGVDVQPGCTYFDFGTCSHKRSHDYFAESIIPGHFFNAQSCSWFVLWMPEGCEDKGALMGYPASPKFKGTFSLETNSKRPFAKNVTHV